MQKAAAYSALFCRGDKAINCGKQSVELLVQSGTFSAGTSGAQRSVNISEKVIGCCVFAGERRASWGETASRTRVVAASPERL